MTGALKKAANQVRAAGRFTDDRLVHMSSNELDRLAKAWGPPTINPETGLPEFFLGDILGGISDAINIVGGGLGDLFGGGSSGGSGGGWLDSLINGVTSLFGGGPQMPSMGAPSTSYGISDTMRGPNDVGGGGSSGGPNWAKLLNLAGGLASFVGSLNKNRQFEKQQDRLARQQKRQWQDWNQHVNYPIGQGSINYGPSLNANTYGFGPGQAQVSYAHGGLTRGALARHMQKALPYPKGRIPGAGTGQSDSVPAMLSKDEYVIPADVVSHWGDGSSEAGAKKFDALVHHTRVARTGHNKFPRQMGGLGQMSKMMHGGQA